MVLAVVTALGISGAWLATQQSNCSALKPSVDAPRSKGRLKKFQTAFVFYAGANFYARSCAAKSTANCWIKPFLNPSPDHEKSHPQIFPEEALKRLEALAQAMQSSEIPLEEALAAYQEGNELVRYPNRLAEVEQKLHVLDEGG